MAKYYAANGITEAVRFLGHKNSATSTRGTATKPGVPTSTVTRLPAHAMTMPKSLAPANTTVCWTDWPR